MSISCPGLGWSLLALYLRRQANSGRLGCGHLNGQPSLPTGYSVLERSTIAPARTSPVILLRGKIKCSSGGRRSGRSHKCVHRRYSAHTLMSRCFGPLSAPNSAKSNVFELFRPPIPPKFRHNFWAVTVSLYVCVARGEPVGSDLPSRRW